MGTQQTRKRKEEVEVGRMVGEEERENMRNKGGTVNKRERDW